MLSNLKHNTIFLVGGIGAKAYITDEFYSVKPSTGMLADYPYSRVHEVIYEDILDHRYRYIPFYNKLKFFDQHTDWYQFLFLRHIREQVCRRVYDEVNGAECVLAHSLGTLAVIGSGARVEQLVLCGSPLGFTTPLARSIVRRVATASNKVQADRLIYLYGTEDPVSSHFQDDYFITGLAKQVTIKKVESTHEISRYLRYV